MSRYLAAETILEYPYCYLVLGDRFYLALEYVREAIAHIESLKLRMWRKCVGSGLAVGIPHN